MDIQTYLATSPRGRARALAEAIHVHPVMVSQWSSGVKTVPVDRRPAIEFATEGAVTCEELGSDVRWHRVADSTWPNPAGRPLMDFAAAEPSQPTVTEA